MNYKPDESTLMAYLYGELEGQEKEKLEQYFSQNPDAQKEFQELCAMKKMLGSVPDKEVIAPPLFVGETREPSHVWRSPYFKTILRIAASLILIIMIGKITALHVDYSNRELRIGFGEIKEKSPVTKQSTITSLTPEEVQQMINSTLSRNNSVMQASFTESQQRMNTSIQKNLVANSAQIDKLIHAASSASQEQIQGYVSGLQRENMKLVKDYFQLTSTDQKKYMEDLLVDFAKYLQQQRNNDLQVVQTRLNSLEKNTDLFKQETEQILSSIITNGGTAPSTGTKN